MKITLVVTNTRGKNVVFISDSLQAMSLEEALQAADKGALENAYSVRGKFGVYLRSLPNVSGKDNLDALSVTAADIIAYANRTRHFQSTDAISMYAAQYIASVLERDDPFIETVDGDKAFVASVRDRIKSHVSIIAQAAKEFEIDLYLLGAILIDEVTRMLSFEDMLDIVFLNTIGRNVSVGLAQIKLETANNLIKKGLYNPNLGDKKLPFIGTLSNKNRKHLYQYVIQSKHNIHFAAALIRGFIDEWKRFINLSDMPEILGTLYHRSYVEPHAHPTSNERGEQIATEFYKLAKKWFADI